MFQPTALNTESWLVTKLQCVETCRKQYQDYSVFNDDLNTCHCIDVLETDLEIINNPYRCEGKHYKVRKYFSSCYHINK